MNPYIEILRPANAVMASIAVLLMAVISHVYNIEIVLGALAVCIATGAGNTINDYYDYEIDKINKPERPIPSGRITLKNALYYSLALFLVATIIGFYISVPNGILVIVCSAIMIIYAYDFKKRCLIGNITVSLLTALTFVFGGLITNDLYISVILAAFAFLMTISREIIKDCEDIEGDIAEGAHTMPIAYGKDKSIKLAFATNILTCILTPLLYVYGIFSQYYMLVVLIADIIFIYCGILTLKNQEKEILHKVSKYMKIAMLIAFVSFIIGSVI